MPPFVTDRGRQRMNHESQSLELGGHLPVVRDRLERWHEEDFARRLWAKDPTLWSVEPHMPGESMIRSVEGPFHALDENSIRLQRHL